VKKLPFSSKTNVMIIFLQKLAVVLAKNANIFANSIGESIYKIVTQVPANSIYRTYVLLLLWTAESPTLPQFLRKG
jgi:hypothetical protein